MYTMGYWEETPHPYPFGNFGHYDFHPVGIVTSYVPLQGRFSLRTEKMDAINNAIYTSVLGDLTIMQSVFSCCEANIERIII